MPRSWRDVPNKKNNTQFSCIYASWELELQPTSNYSYPGGSFYFCSLAFLKSSWLAIDDSINRFTMMYRSFRNALFFRKTLRVQSLLLPTQDVIRSGSCRHAPLFSGATPFFSRTFCDSHQHLSLLQSDRAGSIRFACSSFLPKWLRKAFNCEVILLSFEGESHNNGDCTMESWTNRRGSESNLGWVSCVSSR